MRASFILAICLIFSTLAVPRVESQSGGRTFYVTPGGSQTGDGSAAHPWSLAFALQQPPTVKPGDTIMVRAGSYTGSFIADLNGTAADPITVQAYPGERVILMNSTDRVLEIYNTHYAYFQGLEIAGSETTRDKGKNPTAYGVLVHQGSNTSSDHVYFINMIVHDVQKSGFGWWENVSDSVIYGSLIYYNGTDVQDHGVYVHNTTGSKTLENNFIFDNSSHGVHVYAETAADGLNNITINGNTIFDNGSIRRTLDRNILIGGVIPAINPVITNNYVYFPTPFTDTLNLGQQAGSKNASITNNIFAGGTFTFAGQNSGLKMTGNIVYAPGGWYGVNPADYPDNKWKSTAPTGLNISLRPNKYDPKRANLSIFNWDGQKTVLVSAKDLSGFDIHAGDHYALHNVQNYYSDVVTGVYDGKAIPVPMTGHSMTKPQGNDYIPDSSFPTLGAFVLFIVK